MDQATQLRQRWQHEAAERARYLKALVAIRSDEAAAIVSLGITERKLTEIEDEWLALQP